MFKNVLIIIISFLSCSVYAKEVALGNQNNIYFGFTMGKSSFDHDGLYKTSHLDTRDTKWDIYGGYRLSSWLSVEGQISNLGKYKQIDDDDVFSINNDKYGAFTSSARFNYDLNERFEIFGKTGLSILSLKQNYTFLGNESEYRSYGMGLYFAVGGAFHITENVSVVSQYDIHLFEVEATSLFGRSKYYLQSVDALNLGLQVTF